MTVAQDELTSERRGPIITDAQWRDLLERRATDPGAVASAYAARRRPGQFVSERGTLFLVAADHPARGSLASGGDAMAMADRRSLLARLVEALHHPDVDGVLGTPDIIEELLLLGALEDKVVIGSMNRGGLDGATLDDGRPVHRVRRGEHRRLRARGRQDAAPHRRHRRRARRPPSRPAPRPSASSPPWAWWPWSSRCPTSATSDGALFLRKDAPALSRAVTIASGLGTTSAYTWLKMPACDDFETVFGSTTLPCVVLGGVPSSDPAKDLASWGKTLSHPAVRGLVVGRTLLYPPDGDVGSAVHAAAEVLDTAKRVG